LKINVECVSHKGPRARTSSWRRACISAAEGQKVLSKSTLPCGFLASNFCKSVGTQRRCCNRARCLTRLGEIACPGQFLCQSVELLRDCRLWTYTTFYQTLYSTGGTAGMGEGREVKVAAAAASSCSETLAAATRIGDGATVVAFLKKSRAL